MKEQLNRTETRRAVKDWRREWVKHLIETRYAGKPSAFAKKMERQASYVSRLTAGKKAIGDRLAQEIERAHGLPKYQMDGPLDEPPTGVEHAQPMTLQDQLLWFFGRLSPEKRDSLIQVASRYFIEEHPGPASVVNPFPDAPPPTPSVARRARRK